MGDVKDAQNKIVEGLINRGSGDLRQNNVRSVLAFLDTYENGMITRTELLHLKERLPPEDDARPLSSS